MFRRNELTQFIVMLVACSLAVPTAACYSSAAKYYISPQTKDKLLAKLSNHTDRDIKKIVATAWGGFKVPANVSDQWHQWLMKYKEDEIELHLKDQDEFTKDEGPGAGWPDSFIGFGPGHEGFPPQVVPWGKRPRNRGQPTLCVTKPDPGERCQNSSVLPELRWAYNPYSEVCEQFLFLGCWGNLNNFRAETKCLDTCTGPGPYAGGCSHYTGVPIDYREDFSGVPLEFQNLKNRRSSKVKCTLKQHKI